VLSCPLRLKGTMTGADFFPNPPKTDDSCFLALSDSKAR